ncbi:hypothetical protein ACFY2M_19585 [Streptomyces sp. NPDC001276]|uniref:hypothetical protein n=1 Tax=Streptomyces sp. NPDC001276 TaxID=3364555 RepID=UPI0036AE2F0B
MSLAQDLRTRRRHRGMTPWQLIQKIGRLEQEADESTCRIVELATENDGLRADRSELEAQLRRQAIQASEAIRQLEGNIRLRDRQIDDLQRKVTIGVRAEHVIAKTQELDPEEIRKHCTPVPLWQSPLADPDRTRPAWARTEPDPAA